MVVRRSRIEIGQAAPWAVLGFFVVLPHVFSITALDNFRVPKDAFCSAFILLLGAFFLAVRPFWPVRRPQVVTLILWGGLAYLLLHNLWLARPDVSWPAFRQIFLFSMLLLMLRQLLDDRWQRRVWLAFSASLSASAVVAILQYLGQFPLITRDTGRLLIGRSNPAGLIGDVNSGGFLLGLAALSCLPGVVAEPRPRIRLLYTVILGLNLLGLLFTRTLTALAALGVCAILWLAFYHWWTWRNSEAPVRKLAWLWAVLLPLLVVGAAVGQRAQVMSRVGTVVEQIAAGDWSTATAGRQPVYRITWEMIKERPWVGRGLDSFAQDFFFARTETDYGQQVSLISEGAFREVHDEYLQIWVELGLPALALFLAIWLLPLFRALQRVGTAPDPMTAHWRTFQCLGAMFVLISCLTFFPFHVSSTAAAAILVLAGVMSASRPTGFQGRSLGDLVGSRPVLLWLIRGVIVAAAVAALVLPMGAWRANRQMGIAAFLLEEAQASDPVRQRALADDAANRLDQAHRAAPQIREYWSLRGSAAILRGRSQEALEYYQEAARQLPSSEVLTNLAVAYLAKRDYQAAREQLQTALRYNPNYKPALEALRVLNSREGY